MTTDCGSSADGTVVSAQWVCTQRATRIETSADRNHPTPIPNTLGRSPKSCVTQPKIVMPAIAEVIAPRL